MSSNKNKKEDLLLKLNQQLRKFSTRNVIFQQNIAHSMGLIHTDLKTIDILNETGPITAGEISNITGLSTGTVTALLDRLENAGFVQRERDRKDRRKVNIVPIKAKQEMIKKHYSSISLSTINYCKDYSEQELEMILKFVTDLTAIVDGENQKLL